MATLIKQAYLLGLSAEASDSVNADGKGDVLIADGHITAIAPTLAEQPTGVEIIEGKGQFLGPGLIDLYSQSGEPGHESRETIQSLRQAAAAGGFTRVGLLPNTQPAVDNAGTIATIRSAQQPQNGPISQGPIPQAEVMPWAAITLGTKGAQLSELAELAQAGAIGFTDSHPLASPVLLRRLLEYAQPLQKPIALWPYDPQLGGGGVAREGADALRLGLRGVSAIAETSLLTTLLECVAEIQTPVHLMRISTARSVELIRRAKADGLPISASVPWHHLVFDTHDLRQYGPNLRHDPPLGTPTDRQGLIEGIVDGTLDAIAIDHSPYTYEEKTVAFDATPPGAIGLELALPILWETFVTPGTWSPPQLWKYLTTGPAHCLGLRPPQLAIGALADITLFDPKVSWQVREDSLQSLASNTSFLSQPIQGKVSRIWVSHL